MNLLANLFRKVFVNQDLSPFCSLSLFYVKRLEAMLIVFSEGFLEAAFHEDAQLGTIPKKTTSQIRVFQIALIALTVY